ncbi:TolC family protein [Polynucleobacter sp. Latsch14-2]|jgi:outer membrane protein TolC|uniref:TolC family protein n=1 Tax=Polynucleobacter sp. Latsch14-2 TaxID=2576920 RepID=UPI001C0CBDEA|nr:TolC family protein [Polynucleobacter sp. Latsch14-2]MBU3614560.1 TolC family protein [Polynucleobacter sp. Latsch14-2]
MTFRAAHVLPLLFSVCILMGSTEIHAQLLPTFQAKGVAYKGIELANYISELNESNSTLQMRKLGLGSASAYAQQAGMPYLSPTITYARGSMYTQAPYTGYTNPSSNTLGATVTIEGWGKRSAREAQAIADANRLSAEMVVETKSIETEAIFTYIDALRTKLLWQSYQQAIMTLDKFKEPIAKQRQVDFRSSQKTLSNDLQYFSYSLVNYLGKQDGTLPLPLGNLNIAPRNFNVTELIEGAHEKRVDIASTKAAIEVANANLEVVKASKNIDFNPGLYYTETPPYANSGTNYGAQKSFSFLVSIPLANNLFHDADIVGAASNQAQQEINLQATKTKAAVEINQTYLQYQSAKERLATADKAYQQAKTHSSQSIDGSLKFHDAEVELFDARTVHAKTLILLFRLSGNFDLPSLN